MIQTTQTLVSAGTERMLVESGKANPLAKARQQPDKVRQVLEKVRTDGLAPTLAAVRNKLEQPLPLGYCHVGVVAAVGGGRQVADAGALPPSPLAGEGRGEGEVRPGRPVGHMGYHRRVRYLDVVTDMERIDGERGKSLNALAEQTQALKMR